MTDKRDLHLREVQLGVESFIRRMFYNLFELILKKERCENKTKQQDEESRQGDSEDPESSFHMAAAFFCSSNYRLFRQGVQCGLPCRTCLCPTPFEVLIVYV